MRVFRWSKRKNYSYTDLHSEKIYTKIRTEGIAAALNLKSLSLDAMRVRWYVAWGSGGVKKSVYVHL